MTRTPKVAARARALELDLLDLGPLQLDLLDLGPLQLDLVVLGFLIQGLLLLVIDPLLSGHQDEAEADDSGGPHTVIYSQPLIKKLGRLASGRETQEAGLITTELGALARFLNTLPEKPTARPSPQPDNTTVDGRSQASRGRSGPLKHIPRLRASLVRKLGACESCKSRRVQCTHFNWDPFEIAYQDSRLAEANAPAAPPPPEPPAADILYPSNGPGSTLYEVGGGVWPQPIGHPSSQNIPRDQHYPGPDQLAQTLNQASLASPQLVDQFETLNGLIMHFTTDHAHITDCRTHWVCGACLLMTGNFGVLPGLCLCANYLSWVLWCTGTWSASATPIPRTPLAIPHQRGPRSNFSTLTTSSASPSGGYNTNAPSSPWTAYSGVYSHKAAASYSSTSHDKSARCRDDKLVGPLLGLVSIGGSKTARLWKSCVLAGYILAMADVQFSAGSGDGAGPGGPASALLVSIVPGGHIKTPTLPLSFVAAG
ncbi:hypothetical protein C8A05DRAFT_37074, partial [Staphylotrichum tortipilum]